MAKTLESFESFMRKQNERVFLAHRERKRNNKISITLSGRTQLMIRGFSYNRKRTEEK